ISLLLLLSTTTATWLGALIKSVSNKGSNKALYFKDIELIKVHYISNLSKSTIIANMNLEYIKNKEKGRILYIK
ncbi:hypothetical protein P154DRAFT_447496, partial [Amniculicola lignicola CBS 123094]